MTRQSRYLVFATAALLAAGAAQAQNNVFKASVSRYTTHSSTSGISGIGLPPGADAETGDATTLLLVYERVLDDHFGVELVLGVPPKITARASGSVAFLGEVLTAKVVAPTLLVNYHFGSPSDRFRPYLGGGINYTRFSNITNPFGWDVELKDSVGPAVHIGADYALSKQWSLWGSVAAAKVKSDLVAVGAIVLQSTIDFRPVIYSFGVGYKF